MYTYKIHVSQRAEKSLRSKKLALPMYFFFKQSGPPSGLIHENLLMEQKIGEKGPNSYPLFFTDGTLS